MESAGKHLCLELTIEFYHFSHLVFTHIGANNPTIERVGIYLVIFRLNSSGLQEQICRADAQKPRMFEDVPDDIRYRSLQFYELLAIYLKPQTSTSKALPISHKYLECCALQCTPISCCCDEGECDYE